MDVSETAATERALARVRELASSCERCSLAAERTQVVFGSGPPGARLMIVGEAPGGEEDAAGAPFVGTAGRALNRALEAAHLRREDSYVANVVMCHPPDDRRPTSAEIQACAPYLDVQLALVRPGVVLARGVTAARRLIGSAGPLHELRSRLHRSGSRAVVATYHPSPSGMNRVAGRAGLVSSDLAQVHALLGGDLERGPASSAPDPSPTPR